MLSPRLTNCPECANIPSLLRKIDCKLAELGNNLYNNISYMLNKPVPASDIIQLIGYRRILMYKLYNPNYAYKYSVQMIASRVIRLTAGCVSRCNTPEPCLEVPCDIEIVPNPTTTTTTTISPTTTTTTTTIPPTTTTTTTAGKTVVEILRTTSSDGNEVSACSLPEPATIVYLDMATPPNLQIGDFLYTDNIGTIPFNGALKWWKLKQGSNKYTCQVAVNGEILTKYVCI
jgi:hypothetical protein